LVVLRTWGRAKKEKTLGESRKYKVWPNRRVLRPCSTKRSRKKPHNGHSCQNWQATPAKMNQIPITHWMRTQNALRKLYVREHLLFIFEFSNRFNRLTVKTGLPTPWRMRKLQNLAKLQHRWKMEVPEDTLRLVMSRNGSCFCSWIQDKWAAFVKESACE